MSFKCYSSSVGFSSLNLCIMGVSFVFLMHLPGVSVEKCELSLLLHFHQPIEGHDPTVPLQMLSHTLRYEIGSHGHQQCLQEDVESPGWQ